MPAIEKYGVGREESYWLFKTHTLSDPSFRCGFRFKRDGIDFGAAHDRSQLFDLDVKWVSSTDS